jgi:GrpB-like predicted nucleotidyltransferase (UPF0157 family)
MSQPIVVEYDPSWPDEFEALAAALRPAVEGLAREIHHVGSTSIPGMPGKPVIDIDIELLPGVSIDEITAALEPLGYVFNGDQGIRDRYAYKRVSAAVPFCEHRQEWPYHHLYACPHYSEELARHLVFRDRLRESAELREAYIAIKQEALRRACGVRQVYVDEKQRLASEFVRQVVSGRQLI